MLGAGAAVCCTSMALGASGPSLRAARGCYLLKQPVTLTGTGFAPLRTYTLTIDGVYFGQDTSDPQGRLVPRPVLPGGLPAGYAQSVEHVQASDGISSASTTFTLSRPAGGRFVAISGGGTAINAGVEVWGYSLTGRRRRVYLHLVDPSGHARRTTSLGQTGGQCGYLRSRSQRLFPFTPSRGRWTFQIDLKRTYARHPKGPVQRIPVSVH